MAWQSRPLLILLCMAACSVAVARALLPIQGPPDGDFALFLIPWMQEIHRSGWHSIGVGFEYPPPYIYLLNLVAWIPDPVAAVKLANVPFIVLLAWGAGALAGRTAGVVALILPSMLVNAFAIGQCDVIFASFLVWFLVFAEREKPVWAAVAFGLAFSFKAQALFLAPVVLYLLICGRMRLWHVALIPLTFIATMIPAALAGRPWGKLLTVYLRQSGMEQKLSLNAPNPWWFLRDMDYQAGVTIGLALGAFATLGIALWAWRTKTPILLVACLSAALLPYVLPKMTSRYFFVADVLTLVLAFRRPETWPVAVMIQIGSLVAMASYFTGVGTAGVAFLPMTLGICCLVLEISSRRRGESSSRRIATNIADFYPAYVPSYVPARSVKRVSADK